MLAIAIFLLLLVLELLDAKLISGKVRVLEHDMLGRHREASQLKSEAIRLCTPALFVQSAKLQRKAIAAEKAADVLHQQAVQTRKSSTASALRVAKVAVCALFVVALWRRPVVDLGPAVAWPLQGWLAAPHHKFYVGTGVITAAPWLAIARRVSRLITQSLV